MKKSTLKLIAFLILFTGLVVFGYTTGLYSYLTSGDFSSQFSVMIQENFLKAALLYIIVTVVACSLLAVPGVTFAIIAGTVFGPIYGTLFCLIACTIGAFGAFIAGRYFLRDIIKDRIRANKYIDRILFNEDTKNEMMVLMITRLVPLFPYNLQNFAYGVTDISLAKYSLGTFIFMIPGTAMYTIGASALTDTESRLLYIGIAAVLVIVVTLISRHLKSKYVQTSNSGHDD